MKKVIRTAVFLSFLALPFAALAGNNYQHPQPTPVATTGEGQAFQNVEVTTGQDAGVQNIEQFSVTKTVTKDALVTGSGYGSLGEAKDATLFFGKITGETVKSVSCDITVAKVNAKMNVMDQSVVLAGNAGAYATGNAFADSGNSVVLNGLNKLTYANGGSGVQSYSIAGYTHTNAN